MRSYHPTVLKATTPQTFLIKWDKKFTGSIFDQTYQTTVVM
jgi:hypothetical protein